MSWHPEIGEIQGLVDGELDPRQRRCVEAHLQSCERCRRIAGRLRELSETLRALEAPTPPADLQACVLSAAAQAPRVRELTCAECTELASAYIDGELFGLDRDAFEAHVFTCEACYAALKHMERTALILRETPRTAAPAGLEERVHAAVEAERIPSVFTVRRVVGGLVGLAAAAALLAALILPRGDEPPSTSPRPVVAERPAEVESPAPDVEPVVSEDRSESAAETDLADAASPRSGSSDTPMPRPSSHRLAPVTRIAAASSEEPAVEAGPEDDSEAAVPGVTPSNDPLPEDRAGEATPSSEDGALAEEYAAAPGPSPSEGAPVGRPPDDEVAIEPVLAAAGPVAEEPIAPPVPAAHQRGLTSGASSAPEGPAPEPSEATLAMQPRITGPTTRPQPVPPERASVEATPARRPMRLAVLPTRRGTQIVVEQSPEPRAEILARQSEAVNRESRSAFDNPRTGIELR